MSKIFTAFQENKSTIRKIVQKYRYGKHDVEDLVQEAFLKSFAAEIKHEIRNPKAFLFRVARNVAISEAKKKRHAITNSVEGLGGVDVFKDEAHISAEDKVDGRQKLFVLSQALANLSEDNRQALVMRKIDGLKFKQIALRLDVSVSTVEKRVASALLLCNAHLREKGYDLAEFGVKQKRKQSKPIELRAVKDNLGQCID